VNLTASICDSGLFVLALVTDITGLCHQLCQCYISCFSRWDDDCCCSQSLWTLILLAISARTENCSVWWCCHCCGLWHVVDGDIRYKFGTQTM